MPPLPARAPWQAPELHPSRVRMGITSLRKLGAGASCDWAGATTPRNMVSAIHVLMADLRDCQPSYLAKRPCSTSSFASAIDHRVSHAWQRSKILLDDGSRYVLEDR